MTAMIHKGNAPFEANRRFYMAGAGLVYGFGVCVMLGKVVDGILGWYGPQLELAQVVLFFALGAVCLELGKYLYGQYALLSAGRRGESEALGLLQHLPEGYHVFTNLASQADGMRGEIDALVVGKNGIFAVEVKNHRGEIVTGEGDWQQKKISRGGAVYIRPMRNPIKQMKRNIYILSVRLKEAGVHAWIDGMVYMANPEVSMQQVPNQCTCSGEGLLRYIQGYRPRQYLDERAVAKIVNVLRA